MCVKGGATGLLIIEDGEPFGGASLLFIGECDLVQLPVVMLDDVVEFDRDVRDDKMIGQLQAAGKGDIEAIGSWLQEDLGGEVVAGDVAYELAAK
jgi:hypothetical protein